MTDLYINEEFGFTFKYLGDSPEEMRNMDPHRIMNEQRLILSRDLTKLMEVYSDSKCRIYGRSGAVKNKKVNWVPLH